MSMYIIWDSGFHSRESSKENRGDFWYEFSPLTDAHITLKSHLNAVSEFEPYFGTLIALL